MKRPLQNFSICSPGKAKLQALVQHHSGKIFRADGHLLPAADHANLIGAQRTVTDI